MRRMESLDSVTKIDGSALEGLVLQRLKAWLNTQRENMKSFTGEPNPD
jgi:hypothetical protein